MSYTLKNVSVNRPIVYTLKDGSEFRLGIKESKVIEDNQLDDYLKGLSEKRILMITKNEETPKKVLAKKVEKED